MPGFGHGPFGREPFGEANWPRYTLYELIPELYRDRDEEGYLKSFIEALYPSFNTLRRKIRNFGDLREPRKVPTQYNGVERLRLGPLVVLKGGIEQQGTDGTVNALNEFTSAAGRFRDEDRGKEITISGSLGSNNRSVLIVSVLSLSRVLTSPPLATDIGPLKWELRQKVAQPDSYITVEVRGGDVSSMTPGWVVNDGFKDFIVRARRQFLASGSKAFQTDREGSDGDYAVATGFASVSGDFTPADVGKFLTISGSRLKNDGKYEILAISTLSSPPRLQLRGFLATEAGLTWALLPHPQLDLEGLAIPRGIVEQEGRDLSFIGALAPNDVASLTANFTPADVGKYMRIRGSTVAADNSQFIVTAFVSQTRVTLSGSFPIAATGIYWELRTATATGPTDKFGIDLVVKEEDVGTPGISRVISLKTDFDAGDATVGVNDPHQLEVSGSDFAGNNQTVTVQSVESDGGLLVDGALVLDQGPLTWRLLATTDDQVEPDLTKVQAHPPALILRLAPDFGITVDTQESEDRQRSYIEHVNAWIDLKGHESAYDVIGTISGFDTTVQQLYHIDPAFLDTVPPAFVLEVGEASIHRLGLHGTLTAGAGGRVRFTAPTAIFKPSDVERSIRINNSSYPANNKVYTIDLFVNAQTVEFRFTDTVLFDPAVPLAAITTLPDYGTGGTVDDPLLRWALVRFFSTVAPTLPLFDEIVADQMTDYIDTTAPVGDVFGIDRFCWEDDFAAFFNATITAVTNIGGNTYQVTVSGPADLIPRNPAGPARQVLPRAAWVLQDAASNSYILETVPEFVGPDYRFEVVADPAAPPALGASVVAYQCKTELRCDYCGASTVAVTLELGSLAAERGISIERVLERVLIRENEEPKPAHVELILILKQILEATLEFEAEMITGREVAPPLLAPLGAFFDDIEADVIPADHGVGAEVEGTKTIWVGLDST